MSDTVRPEAAALADWWVGKLQAPRFDNGAKDEASVMAGLMTTMSRTPVTPEQVEAFRDALAAGIDAQIDAGRYSVPVGTDYEPDRVLGAALEAAGLNPHRMDVLPWKTMSWVRQGVVTVGDGYQRAPVQIYPPADAPADPS